jgi:hypothetical protein
MIKLKLISANPYEERTCCGELLGVWTELNYEGSYRKI